MSEWPGRSVTNCTFMLDGTGRAFKPSWRISSGRRSRTSIERADRGCRTVPFGKGRVVLSGEARGGEGAIGAKIVLDPARGGLILGADARRRICSEGSICRGLGATSG